MRGEGEMEDSSNGILSTFLAGLPQWVRPYAEAGILAFVALSAFAVIVNPILELARRLRDLFKRRPSPPTLAKPPEAPPQESVGRIIWLSKPVAEAVPPLSAKEGGLPIITLGNMKGGVGKTTVTANLAAYFDKTEEKRVLLIDFDYQGSLSSTVLAEARTSRFRSLSDDLILGEKEPLALLEGTQTLHPAMPRSRIFTCYYDFSNTETFVLANWLMGNGAEIRFRLSKLLQSEAVRKAYDIVLIDAGPRFTTSTINALTASNFLLIPTILDEMSAQAVSYFSKELDRHRNQLFPALQLMGVVPTFVAQDPEDATSHKFSDTEKASADRLDRDLHPIWGTENSVLREGRVPDRRDYAKIAGYGIAYFHYADAERSFSRLGRMITKRLRNEGFRI